MQLSNLLKNIASNIILAIFYFLFGLMGLKLGFLSGYATAIYPASGLAFVAILCGGTRFIPSVWLGSACINLYITSTFGEPGFSHLVIAMLTGASSALQAWLASSIVNRFGRADIKKLISNKDVLLFLFLAGPIACLVASSLSSAILLTANIISINELISNWFYWWLGDTVGVVLISPLLLMFWYHKELWWKERVKNIFTPTIIALSTTILAFSYVSEIEKTNADRQLQKISQAAANKIKTELTTYKEVISSIARFVQVTPNIQYAEFEKFTLPIFNTYPSLYALSWNPRINDSYRTAYQLEMAEQLDIADFYIKQKDENKQLIKATKRDWYVPTTYISPRHSNEKAFGYDIASTPLRINAINQATDNNKIIATSPIRLVQETGNSVGVLFIKSISNTHFPSIGITSNSNSPVGFAVAVVRIENLITNLFNNHSFNGFKLGLEDKNADKSNKVLYRSDNKLTSTYFDYFYKTDLNINGREWQLTIEAVKDDLLMEQSLLAWQILFFGLLLTSFLQILLLIITGQSYSAHQKTLQSNIDLEKSEKKLKTMFEEAPLGIAVIDSYTGDINNANPAYAQIAGRSIEELKAIDWMQITHPDDVQEDLDNMAQMNSGKTSGFTMQKRYIQPNGNIRWINMTIAPMQVEGNSDPRHLCMTKDITEDKLIEEQLIASEERLRLSQLYGGIGTWEADFKSNTEIWSDVVTQKLGFPDISTPTWDDFLNVIHPDDRDHVVKIIDQHLNDGKELNVDYRIIDTQGNVRWMNSIGKADFDVNGKPIKLIGTVQDISERKLIEEKLLLSSKVINNTNEGITITDASGKIIDVNPAFYEITGYSRDEVIGQTPKILSSGKHSSDFFSNMWKTINDKGHWQGEIWNRKKDGTLYAELLSISSIEGEDGKPEHYIGIFSDITHSKQQQETLELMAHYDVLTQLPNRVLLADRFIQALAHSKRHKTLLAVCFLDLDHFKPVNDLYGHETGDQLLVEVAERIKDSIRDEDTVSRQGGDEFILLLGDIDSYIQCEYMLKRIIKSLSQPYIIDQQKILISASIGVSLYPIDDSDLDTLMRHADLAMYQAKLAGRNCYSLFNTEKNQLDVEKTIKQKELENALINNELCLFYQPKVNMATGEVFGAEALIRWNHPEKGLVPPLQFLPIIEETALEIQVGNWVINEALQQLDNWDKQNIELEVSINISSYHLQSPSFVNNLEKALALYPQINSKQLQLEILESSALGELNLVKGILKTCTNALGVKIALDDFGTGYSSLTHLRNLPAETIKIDQTFVRDILDDPSDYAIIDSVIGLANAFNRGLIAEGVETTEHGLMLLIMGCQQAQGYGIARPMPALNIPEWLTNYIPNQQWLSFANKARTPKENKIKLFRLTLVQWQKHFEKNIQSLLENKQQWPILKRTQCHCGVWIKRARQEQLFEDKSLEILDRVHDDMHDIADKLFNQYQEGNVYDARANLKDLQIAVDNMSNALGQCE